MFSQNLLLLGEKRVVNQPRERNWTGDFGYDPLVKVVEILSMLDRSSRTNDRPESDPDFQQMKQGYNKIQ